jgi:hypothetical protein
MRWLLAIALCITAATVYGQEDAARELFQSMEKKVRDAKSLKIACKVEGRFSPGGEQMKVEANQQFAGASKARFEVRTGEHDSLFVSDGTQMVRGEAGRVEDPKPSDPKLNEGLAGTIARGGFMLPRLVRRPEAGSFDAEKTLLLSGFRLGAKERIGKAEAQIVEHTVKFGGSATGPSESVKVIIWIDPQTRLPLKRTVYVGEGEADFFTEVYTEFLVDPKLDAKVFELPK